jgi:hypothetical protein
MAETARSLTNNMVVHAGSLNFKMAVFLKFEDGRKFKYGGKFKYGCLCEFTRWQTPL